VRAASAVAALAAGLPLVRKPGQGIREWVRAERGPECELVVTVMSLPPEDAFVWLSGSADGLESFIESRRFSGRPRTPWDAACRRRLLRKEVFGNACVIEPGAAWFVEWLESKGAETIFSCEGHPSGFEVIFRGSYELAHAIAGAPYVDVEIFRSGRFPQPGQWRLHLQADPDTRAKRDEILRRLADALAALTFDPPV
jgi:hypothetical protein